MDGQSSIVELHDAAGEAEADTASPFFSRKEGGEDGFLPFGRDTGTGIGHGNQRSGRRKRGFHMDLSIGLSVNSLQCIADKVDQSQDKQVGIDMEGQRFGRRIVHTVVARFGPQ